MPDSQVQFNTEKQPIKKVYYTGSDTLQAGYVLCYDADSNEQQGDSDVTAASANIQRVTRVEKPTAANLKYFAGVVAEKSGGITGPGQITIVQPTAGGIGVKVWTTASTVVDSTQLYLTAGSYALTTGGSLLVARALQTIDRSSTAGTVLAFLKTSAADTGMSARSRTTVQLPTAAIWNHFPLEELRANPMSGALLETDFTNQVPGFTSFVDATYAASAAGKTPTEGVYPGVTALGELVFFTTTDNQAAEVQFPCPIDIDTAGAKWAFEARLKAVNITTEKGSFEIGLSSGQNLVGDLQADAGAAPTVGTNYVLFNSDAAATSALDVRYLLSGQTADEHDAAVKTMVADTYFTVGLYYDGTDIQVYIDGVNTADPILSTDMADGNFPTGTFLVPTIGVKGAHADDYSVTVDWIRVAQIAS